ncbi:carboxylesterase family protein [Planctomicrobium piriforme]|uniref:carboxylesterase family protein n=1 Tax=Planctomicrobium piriforme TaxID=1576369 RepID=UPI001587B258|nr:alpha/beta fold hydrolase [Planctomicrobium piriforme]
MRSLAFIVTGAAVYCIVIAAARGVTRRADAPPVEPETIAAFQYCSVMSRKGLLQARLLPPEQRDSRVPLVVFLHGSGERGTDNVRQLQPLSQKLFKDHAFPCCILAPQCVPDTPWMHWMPELEELIERTLQDDRIDPDRVYLIGFSMGGSGCWELAARRPDLFAAAVPICGGGRTDWAASLKDLPIWAIHGSEDRAVSPERTREMIAAIEAVGGHPRFTELLGVGHGGMLYTCDPNSGVLDWVFKQKRESVVR